MSSIITVNAKKNDSLTIFLDAIASGTSIPREVIVIDLTGNAETHKAYNFMVKVQQNKSLNGAFPISTALNLGARKAWDDNLIFLDVNCIPAQTFIQKMEEHLLCGSGLIMGEPRVLKLPVLDRNSASDLFANSLYNPLRPDLKKELTLCFDPTLFWGQGFGISKKEFEELGGFDENYKDEIAFSYLDFVFKLFKNKKDFYLSKNTFYHSYEEQQAIAGSDLQSIVHHSNYFYEKWSDWPMKVKLAKLVNQGLIAWSENQTAEIKILKNADLNLITNGTNGTKEALVNSKMTHENIG